MDIVEPNDSNHTTLETLPKEILYVICNDLDLEDIMKFATSSKKLLTKFGVEKVKQWKIALNINQPDRDLWINAIKLGDEYIIKYYTNNLQIDMDIVKFTAEINSHMFKLIFEHYIKFVTLLYSAHIKDYILILLSYRDTYASTYEIAQKYNYQRIINYLTYEGGVYIFKLLLHNNHTPMYPRDRIIRRISRTGFHTGKLL